MSTRDVTIRISAQDSFSAVMQKLNRELTGVKTNSTQVQQQTSRLGQSFGQLGRELQMAAFGFGALQLGRTILDLRQTGESLRATEMAFRNLTGGTREAEAALQLMRQATGGVVADSELMAGANRLLLMNLAKTGEEAAKLTQIAVTLGRVMGQDASQSIEAFSLMLSNRSIPRLDNFGIAAGEVRKRVQELKDAGMDMDEAFTTAVLEQGTLAMERLGNATEANVSAWGQLSAVFAGVKDDIAAVVFTAGEAAAQIFLIAQAIDELANTSPETLSRWVLLQAEAAGTPFANQIGGLFHTNNPEDVGLTSSDWTYNFPTAPDASEIAAQQSARQAQFQWAADRSATLARNNALQWRRDREQARDMRYRDYIWGEAARTRGQITDLEGFAGQGRELMDSRTSGYFTQDEAASLREQADIAQDIVAQFEEAAKNDLISDAELERIRGFANEVGDMADAAERGADAFDRIKLSDVFGQAERDLGSEIEDDIVATLRGLNVDEEIIAAYQRVSGFEQGTITEASEYYEQTYRPQIARAIASGEITPEQAAQATSRAEQVLSQGALDNLSQQELIHALDSGATGFMPGGGTRRQFEVTSGMTDWEAAQGLGYSSLDEMYREQGWSPGRVPVGMAEAGAGGGAYLPITDDEMWMLYHGGDLRTAAVMRNFAGPQGPGRGGAGDSYDRRALSILGGGRRGGGRPGYASYADVALAETQYPGGMGGWGALEMQTYDPAMVYPYRALGRPEGTKGDAAPRQYPYMQLGVPESRKGWLPSDWRPPGGGTGMESPFAAPQYPYTPLGRPESAAAIPRQYPYTQLGVPESRMFKDLPVAQHADSYYSRLFTGGDKDKGEMSMAEMMYPGGMGGWGADMSSTFTDSMTTAAQEVGTNVSEELDAAIAMPRVLQVALELTANTAGLPALLKPIVEELIRNAGGTAPGTVAGTQTSSRSSAGLPASAGLPVRSNPVLTT